MNSSPNASSDTRLGRLFRPIKNAPTMTLPKGKKTAFPVPALSAMIPRGAATIHAIVPSILRLGQMRGS